MQAVSCEELRLAEEGEAGADGALQPLLERVRVGGGGGGRVGAGGAGGGLALGRLALARLPWLPRAETGVLPSVRAVMTDRPSAPRSRGKIMPADRTGPIRPRCPQGMRIFLHRCRFPTPVYCGVRPEGPGARVQRAPEE